EGEAIAWHLYEGLGLDPTRTRRIVFHEITKKAILKAIEHPRDIDTARVDAQQARRVLDRIVGFELSPVLWKRLKPALSAGRVQSVAVRLIVDREKEIESFVSEPYFRVGGTFGVGGSGTTVKAELHRRLSSPEEAEAFVNSCAGAAFKVGSVTVKPATKSPAPPFTTSTLQQEASRRLGFTVSQTMMLAQKLYENGHITYMRTDSLNLSEDAIAAMAKTITDRLGKEYSHARRYHTNSKGAQEAHEAIRPTYAEVETLDDASAQEQKLYTLIRRRALASQMADARLERTTAEIVNDHNDSIFTANGETVVFDGFLRLYDDTDTDGSETDVRRLLHLTEGEALSCNEISATERFTQHPPRYTEATLVKKMEELGIGRPSTYAPTISTIQQRGYVERGEREGTPRNYLTITLDSKGKITREERTENTGSDKGKLVPTDIGVIVNDFLTAYFPDILDYNFTARIEERFDDIAEGKLPWNDEIATFYKLFHPAVDSAMTIKQGRKFGERLLGTDPASGKPVSAKIGRFGPVVQIGDTEDDEKPRFASLLQGQSLQTITLEEALRLFDYPRTLGTFEGKDVTVAVGRFGPYVRHDGKFASIPKDIQPGEVTLPQAIELIEAKRKAEAEREIKTFAEDPELHILRGRYGVYMAKGKKNYKLPKSLTEPEKLTYSEALAIMEDVDKAPAKPRRTARKK
ncbi:MAG: type I DNA topoisomerase, partial [Roseburia sp.]|nr:type I DNA topoisomerase [Roseburia sp.]